MRDKKKSEEIAAQRMQLLSPLLAEDLDAAKARQLKARICEQAGISERTLRRYLSQYRKEGFDGLKPKGKGEGNLKEAIPAYVLEQAILLRREVPKRSVTQIIQILEWEGLVEPGQIKRSTLQEKLAEKGYSYQNKPHSALMNNVSPETAFRNDPKPLRFSDAPWMSSMILHLLMN